MQEAGVEMDTEQQFLRPLPSISAAADVAWDAIKPVIISGGDVEERSARGRVFVAGNSSLPGAVFSALAHVAHTRGEFQSHEAALKFVKDLERKRVIVVESWS